MDELKNVMAIAASGLRAQSTRLQVIAQNVANSDSTASVPGGDPYARKTITFKNVMDRERGIEVLEVDSIDRNREGFQEIYDPTHPAAGDNGVVLRTNVNRVVEMADFDQAQRAYEANLNMIEQTKSMVSSTLELLR